MKRRRYSKLIAAVYSAVWAILPEKLQEICGVLDLRSRGVRLSREEIRARVGDIEQPPLVEYFGAAAGARLTTSEPVNQPRIAVLNLFGTIAQRMNLFMEYSGGTSTELFGKAFEQVVADNSVTAIVINTDSPGGTISGTPELAEKIYAARGRKPIVAIANPMMASAAYWIASAADEIVAQPSAFGIGSIGALIVHREESKANEQDGVKYTVVRSVEQKAAVNSWEPLSDAARQDLEDIVADAHGRFVADVAKHRGIEASAVNEKFGQGRAFPAHEALERGLVDRLATFESLLTELSGRADAQQQPPKAAGKRRAPQAKESDTMNPKIKLALIKAGLAKAGDPDAQFQAALELFYAAEGKAKPADEAQILTDLAGNAPAAFLSAIGSLQPVGGSGGTNSGATTAPAAGLSLLDITGLVQTGAAMLTADDRLELLNALQTEHAKTPLTVGQVLDRINEKARAGNKPAGQQVTVVKDRRDKFHAAARDAILCAAWGGSRPNEIFDFRTRGMVDWEPGDAAGNFGLQTPIKIGMQCLIECGVPANRVLGMSKADIAQLMCGADAGQLGYGGLLAADGPAYNVSGMFSNLLLDATNVLLRRSYNDGRTTFQQWMRQAESIEDFKPVHKVIAGELGDPKAIPEDGEFEETTFTDGKESYKLTLWGEIFSHSWELMINDRLGSLTEGPMKLGRAMKRKQNRLSYQVLKDNAALSDAVALFHSTHSNNNTGALSTVAEYTAAFGAMARKMREQRGLSSASAALNLSPRWVVFCPAIRDKILTALASVSVVTSGNAGEVNIWKGMLEPIEEAELGLAAGGTDTQFFAAADAGDIDTIEYAYLQGYEAPRLEQAVAFSRLAIRQRIYQAFAVKAIDHRGLQRHTGA